MAASGYDVIIVGAGSAGCVLANRLSADPSVSVLLLEAGGADRHRLMAMPLAWMPLAGDPKVGWGYATQPEPYADGRTIDQPRGKVLGGTSSINGMMYSRGQAADYDGWAAAGLKGWSHAEVLPYFRRAEANWRGESAWHGGSGPLTVIRHAADPALHDRLIAAAQALGHQHTDDFNGPSPEGFGAPDFTIRRGRRASTAKAYLEPALGRPNLTVRTGALADRVLFQDGRAAGVTWLQDGTRMQARAAREVVLSGGTFNSPQILLRSGLGPADELRALGIEPLHDLPGVGRGLQDHPMSAGVFAASGPVTFDSALRLDRMAIAWLRWALGGSGPIGGLPFAVQGFYRSCPELARPDIQMQVSPVSFDARVWFPGWRKGSGHIFSVGNLLLRPRSRGSVTLRSADPAAAPDIRFNLFQAEADLVALRHATRAMRAFFAAPPAAGLVAAELFPGPAAETDAEIDAMLRATAMLGMHATSTCAMGEVVDAELKVIGTRGLRVVDCSVMPGVVSGNTNAPAIMIAEKASDMILGRPPLAVGS